MPLAEAVGVVRRSASEGEVMDSFAFGPRVRSHKKAIAIGLLIGLLVAATVAVAAWLTSGTGPGYSKARSLQLLTIPAMTADEIAPSLYPGQSGDLTVRIANPNAALQVVAVAQAGAIVSDNPGGCPASSITFTNTSGLSIPLAAGVSTITVPGVVSMAVDAPSTCQGATFTIPVQVNATT
jgi:hypothetical protein